MDKMDISSTSSVHLVADADFVSSPVAFRVHVASDANRSDPCHEKNHLFFCLVVVALVILTSVGVCSCRGDEPFRWSRSDVSINGGTPK